MSPQYLLIAEYQDWEQKNEVITFFSKAAMEATEQTIKNKTRMIEVKISKFELTEIK